MVSRSPAGGWCEVRYLGVHRCVHFGCCRNTERTAGNDHWAFTDLLPLVGATHEKSRVVKDGNVITAAGVTSGIDFGLSVVAEIAGETTAQTIQLGIEYDPAPPFDSGHPDRAPAAIKSALLSGRYDEARSAFQAGIDSATRL